MDPAQAAVEASFLFDLTGRVRNLGLPANSANALVPLFEAVSNAIHAVESRWGEKVGDFGEVKIVIRRRNDEIDSNVVGFTILDNGIGLTEENWNSFRTSDSPHKQMRGGKGVGRLSWLKAFENCRIVSIFNESGTIMQRDFLFNLKQINPIQNHSIKPSAEKLLVGTKVFLDPFFTNFEVYCPKKLSTIAAKLVGHFLPYLAVDKCPKIVVEDGLESIELRAYYGENQTRNTIDIVTVTLNENDGPEQFFIHHTLLRKQLKFLDSGLHWMFFAGNQRVARQDTIDGQLGLRYVGEAGDCVYIGLITGSFLDKHVNQERTNFTFSNDIQAELHKTALSYTKAFLNEYIQRIRDQQIATADRVIRENPQFLPFRDRLDTFVSENFSLNTQGEEEIYVELSRRKLRAKRRIDGQIRSLSSDSHQRIDASVQEITKALNDEKKGSLAEYVVRRKAILELLDSSLGYEDPITRKYFREEAIHGLIVPLRSDSEELDYTQHNLWILDDRLAFYTFFRSDRQGKDFIQDSDSKKEPDLSVVFENALAMRGESQDEPIIIVEFKRPGRDDFTGNTNPVAQILDYVDIFRSGSAIKDNKGNLIRRINMSTRFVCYIVADFTNTLIKVARSSIANHPTADGRGYFGTSIPHNATVEILPYEKIVSDAKIRNEAFFRQLGLL